MTIYKVGCWNDASEVLNHAAVLSCVNRSTILTEMFQNVISELQSCNYSRISVRFNPNIRQTIFDVNGGIITATTNVALNFFQTLEFEHTVSNPFNGAKPNASLKLMQSVCHFALTLRFICPRIDVQMASVPTSEENFSKQIYGTYRLKMKEFALTLTSKYTLIFNGEKFSGTPFLEDTQALLEQIFNFNPDDSKDFRNSHFRFLLALRGLISSKDHLKGEFEQQVFNFVDEINLWIYTNDELLKLWREKFKSILPDLEKLTDSNFFNSFNKTKEMLESRLNRVNSVIGDCTDLHMDGNLITKMFTIREIPFIRMSNQVSVINNVSLLPEFKNFAELVGRFFYGNMMKTSEPEKPLTSCLHTLNKVKECKVMTFDRSSDYAMAAGKYIATIYNHLHELELYKQFLVDRLCTGSLITESPFVLFPEPLQGKELEETKIKFLELLDKLHCKYFNNCETLENNERAIFNDLALVEVFYSYLKDNPFKFMTIACRASIDRGPSFFTLLYIRDLIEKGVKFDENVIREILFLFFIHAIINDNRLPHNERIIGFSKAAEMMISQTLLATQ